MGPLCGWRRWSCLAEMSDEVEALIERSIQAYRRGRFMRLFGKDYQQYVESRSDAEVAEEILRKPKYHEPLQEAFQHDSPRPDEIYLYAIRGWGVLTSQRLFLLDRSGLMRPPIELADVVIYKGPRRSSPEKIELSTGETIERRPKRSPDGRSVRR